MIKEGFFCSLVLQGWCTTQKIGGMLLRTVVSKVDAQTATQPVCKVD